MTPSLKGEALIKSFESCKLTAYLPLPTDHPTIGWGTTGPDIYLGLTWTKSQADIRFDTDLRRFGQSLSTLFGANPTTQAQFDACLSLAYNIGAGAFAKSTLLKKHNAGDYDGAAQQFMLWNKSGGKVVTGLTARRQAEQRMYKGL